MPPDSVPGLCSDPAIPPKRPLLQVYKDASAIAGDAGSRLWRVSRPMLESRHVHRNYPESGGRSEPRGTGQTFSTTKPGAPPCVHPVQQHVPCHAR